MTRTTGGSQAESGSGPAKINRSTKRRNEPNPSGSGPAGAATMSRPAKSPTHEQIAERARAIWRSKGCPPGQDKQNWLEAEAQLKVELGSSRSV